MNRETETILEVKQLEKSFALGRNHIVKAVDQVSFAIAKGEIFGLAGESGSGKSTLGKCIAGIEYPDKGTVRYRNIDITRSKTDSILKKETRRKIQTIYQDPKVSMNPRMNIEKIMEEPMKLLKHYASKAERRIKIVELLGQVGIPENILERYPSELSGGQNQRVCIARALACEPEVIVADEPTASLDVTIRAQITELFQALQVKKGICILLITHDLTAARRICNRIGIMNHGELVETGVTKEVCRNPQHAYTKALLSAIPPENPYRKSHKGIFYE